MLRFKANQPAGALSKALCFASGLFPYEFLVSYRTLARALWKISPSGASSQREKGPVATLSFLDERTALCSALRKPRGCS